MSIVINGVRDFLIEVSKGKIAGHSVFQFDALAPAPQSGGTAFSDVWGGSQVTAPVYNLAYPTGAETLEIISTSANDAAAGTGARTVTITYLDASYNQLTQVVALNGTTPVALNNDYYRILDAEVATAGSLETNEGDITIQVLGGGAPRRYILAGFGVSKDGHYTVPAGFSALIVNTVTFFAKNDDGQIRGSTKSSSPDSPWVVGAVGCFYQSPFVIPTALPGLISEGTDIKITTTSTNGLEVTGFFEILLIENSVL